MDSIKVRLLVVDAERALGAGVQEILRRDGAGIDLATDARTAHALVRLHAYAVVVIDAAMPETSPLHLLQQARQGHAPTQVVVMSGPATVDAAIAAARGGAYDYVMKPLDAARLRLVVAKAAELHRVLVENDALRQRLRRKTEPSPLVGESDAIRRAIALAHEAARTDAAVLIEGEAGTGKELLARLIHEQSARAAWPFVIVDGANCPGVADEVDLFSGARTPARTGGNVAADGGTLYLPGVAGLSSKRQADILRILEDASYRPPGATEPVRANVRIVASVNKSLGDAVAAGRFRPDLFDRLRAVTIALPPLRQRPEDIPLLVESFLEHFAMRHKRRRKTLSPEAMAVCRRFSWPGNVRELRNTIERLVITSVSAVIGADELPEFLAIRDPRAAACDVRPGMTIADCERILICQTLLQATANREQAARLLGISRRALQYKLKAYGLLGTKRGEPLLPPPVADAG